MVISRCSMVSDTSRPNVSAIVISNGICQFEMVYFNCMGHLYDLTICSYDTSTRPPHTAFRLTPRTTLRLTLRARDTFISTKNLVSLITLIYFPAKKIRM